jgi:hypothetical protein
MLHAWRLGFTHPVSGEFKICEAPVPREFEPFLPDPGRLELIRKTSPDALGAALHPDA